MRFDSALFLLLFTLFTLLAYLNYTPQTPCRSPGRCCNAILVSRERVVLGQRRRDESAFIHCLLVCSTRCSRSSPSSPPPRNPSQRRGTSPHPPFRSRRRGASTARRSTRRPSRGWFNGLTLLAYLNYTPRTPCRSTEPRFTIAARPAWFNGLTLLAYLNYTPRTPSQNWTPDSL